MTTRATVDTTPPIVTVRVYGGDTTIIACPIFDTTTTPPTQIDATVYDYLAARAKVRGSDPDSNPVDTIDLIVTVDTIDGYTEPVLLIEFPGDVFTRQGQWELRDDVADQTWTHGPVIREPDRVPQ